MIPCVYRQGESDFRRLQIGGSGGKRFLRRRPAAIGGELGRHAIFLVVAELLGSVDRGETTVLGTASPILRIVLALVA